jgi:hypothetical protein
VHRELAHADFDAAMSGARGGEVDEDSGRRSATMQDADRA